ncbi:esterase [Arachidicoccus ginsenosidimutans]|uniref:esterase family protein n=1 Tax=Arachidicoccus sp. BS20 TaxID=1850526 RepID=UPI0007F104F0|nr:alpha/beta hydrolase-fold protein [Arachidicoccus sp. BS20]ANI88037.1 esterase [Arachidicoccus sp. BS20]
MQEFYHKWYSPIIGKDMEMLVFGHSGRPVILFPTSQGKYYEAKDRGLIQSVEWFIDNGFVKIYCVDSIDSWSWYNKNVHPATRAYNHTLYDRYIAEEVLPLALHETGWHTATVAGCSFGGYHAANFAFRHPEKNHAMISMSGVFDIKSQVDNHYDDNVYFNNPVDYLPNDDNGALWQLQIILGTSYADICYTQNVRLSEILSKKNINYRLDIRGNAPHDWNMWLEMFPHYLSVL